ncbi:hypothetical protein SAMN02787100_0402 [Chryseobacterium sp. OV279]|nr:hypothetical protein SAMN02787100_0402 [Chryseobacterium sp. OV279]
MAKKTTEKEDVTEKAVRTEGWTLSSANYIVIEPASNYERVLKISKEGLINPSTASVDVTSASFSYADENEKLVAKLEKRVAYMEKIIFSDRSKFLSRRQRHYAKEYVTTYNLESPYEDKIYSVSFEKNKYISNEDNLWKVIYIMDHKEIFESTLHEFDNHINDDFIEALFRKSSSHYYIDHLSNRIFTKKNSDQDHYKLISLAGLLEYLTINEIEALIQQGIMAYE